MACSRSRASSRRGSSFGGRSEGFEAAYRAAIRPLGEDGEGRSERPTEPPMLRSDAGASECECSESAEDSTPVLTALTGTALKPTAMGGAFFSKRMKCLFPGHRVS